MSGVRTNVKIGIATAAAVLVLASASTVAIAAVTGGFGPGETLGSPSWRAPSTSACAVPSLPGTVVDVTLADMGGRMGPGGQPGSRPGGGMGGGRANGYAGPGAVMAGMMSVDVSSTSVPSGTVSLRVANDGVRVHELVILPLADGAQPGQRAIGSNGRVDEGASLGEASATCASGEGDGIAAGSAGWTTLTLAPGRYELVCNLPGHYAAGMYAELDVTG